LEVTFIMAAHADPGAIGMLFVALFAAHQVADHWIQTQHQADTKSQQGWIGRLACLRHVSTYTLTAILAVVAVCWRADYHPTLTHLTAGLAISALTHYLADRRTPLRRIAQATGSGPFYQLTGHGINGVYLLDQSWHIAWLLIAALVIA
jgi:hypothetical protein